MSAVDWGGRVSRRRGSEGSDPSPVAASRAYSSGAHPNLLRALIEHTTDIVTVVAADGTITFQSPACRRVLGYEPQELIGTSSFNLVHPDDLPWVMPLFADLVASAGVAPPVRVRCRHRDGSWVELEAVGNSLFDQPEVAGMVISSRDIGAQVRAERKTAALLEIAQTISATPEIDPLLARVQPDIAKILQADIVATYCCDPNGTMALQACHSPGSLASAVHALAQLDPEATWTPCVERGESIVLNGVKLATSPATSAAAPKIKSVAMLPLSARGQTIGVLVVARCRTEAAFLVDDIELCRGIAGHLGVAIARAHFDRARQVEVLVTGAIARVGQQLISCLDTPALVDRLCRVTTEVLGCDFCATRFSDASRDMLVHASDFGFTTEEQEGLRPITIPRSMLPLQANELWYGSAEDLDNPQLEALAHQFDISGLVIIPLRRGTELIGVQAAGFRRRHARFAPPQIQIARAIGQLAAMAIENARLVEELQRASRLKSEFVATMSHELRTPLNVIIGYTDLLMEDSFGPINGEQRQVCRRVARSAEELLGLINATLDVGRLETGRLPLDLEDVSMPDLAAAVEAETRDLCDKPNVSMQWHIDADMPLIHTDPLKVKVILKNLVANAMKFTAAGEVEVRIEPEGTGVALAVRDTGIGVPTDLHNIIFEPFRQGDGSMSRRFGGVGLGLYIVRRLVDALGGTVSMRSEVGKGSMFRVYLPSAEPRERT